LISTRKYILIVLASILLLFSAAASALEIPDNIPSWKDMDAEKLAELLEFGDLIAVDTIGDTTIEMVSIAMLVNAPQEQVWNTVTDFVGYGQLMPDTLQTEVLVDEGNMKQVHFSVNVIKLGAFGISSNYTLKYNLDPPDRADISWVEGDVKNVAGFWELHPVDGGKKTVVIYAITSDLASTPMVGRILAKQPATVMAINLSSAIVFTERLMEEAAGEPRPKAPEGTEPQWRTMPPETLDKLLGGGRVGFIARIGSQEIAVAGVKCQAPQERVWNVLTDFEKYPDKIQQIVSSKVLEKTETSARVKTKMVVISLGLGLKIATSGINSYSLNPPSGMSVVDEENPDSDLFNRWELFSLDEGESTGLINESVSDISEMGRIANMMLERLPALQISVDLSQGMIMANEMKKWAESSE